ncbi:MAG: 8-amino-7-oxononanoate synthase [Pirellulales bacterium]
MARQVSSPLDWIDAELERLDGASLRRRLATRQGRQGPLIQLDGQQLLNFGSNDYLSLAGDPRLAEAVSAAAQEEGWGAGASPLILGHGASHQRLEKRLARFEGTEAALLFSTGFAANVAAITALAERGDAIFADQLNHASLIDGCRLSRADVHVYPHGDMRQLAELLAKQTSYRRRLVVSDSLFSMDGDAAPLAKLAELAARHNCMLLLDEAHATGVFGPRGRGLAEEAGIHDQVHIHIGTLSKAVGCSGGFVCGSQALIDWMVNRARPYIFSTAPPPASSAAALCALDIIETEPQRRRTLLTRAAELRGQLLLRGWKIGGSISQVIPLIVGDAERALALAAQLRRQGIFVPPIRPPSVSFGQSLLRISLTYGHTSEMVERLLAALDKAPRSE